VTPCPVSRWVVQGTPDWCAVLLNGTLWCRWPRQGQPGRWEASPLTRPARPAFWQQVAPPIMRTASHCALKVKCARCGVACGGDCGMWLGRGDIGSNTPFRLPIAAGWWVSARQPGIQNTFGCLASTCSAMGACGRAKQSAKSQPKSKVERSQWMAWLLAAAERCVRSCFGVPCRCGSQLYVLVSRQRATRIQRPAHKERTGSRSDALRGPCAGWRRPLAGRCAAQR
jgi:hypothetical protein